MYIMFAYAMRIRQKPRGDIPRNPKHRHQRPDVLCVVTIVVTGSLERHLTWLNRHYMWDFKLFYYPIVELLKLLNIRMVGSWWDTVAAASDPGWSGGGRKPWSIRHRGWRPSFLWLVLTGAWGGPFVPPWIRSWADPRNFGKGAKKHEI